MHVWLMFSFSANLIDLIWSLVFKICYIFFGQRMIEIYVIYITYIIMYMHYTWISYQVRYNKQLFSQ